MASLKRSPLYSEELGIALPLGGGDKLFKWFLASVLFGGRISATIAARTYRAFVHHDLLTPRKVLHAGWDFLVCPVMRKGGYVRYDGRKSTQVLRNCERLLERYQGSLSRLHALARDSADLEWRLLDFYGVGPVTVSIFLRELRPFWSKANPEPLARVVEAADCLGIGLDEYKRKTMAFARIEAGLLRLGKRVEQQDVR